MKRTAILVAVVCLAVATPGLAALVPAGADRSDSQYTFGTPVSWSVGATNSYAGIGSQAAYEVNGTAGFAMLGSTAEILAGDPSSASDVSMAWRTRSHRDLLTADIYIYSDAVKVSGIAPILGGLTAPGRYQTDMFVLQMSYDPTLANGHDMSVGYLNVGTDGVAGTEDDVWRYAVSGNLGSQDSLYFHRAFNATTDFQLGYEGMDTENHVAWAVVNYEGQFAVIPEPTTLAVWSLLGGIGVAYGVWRKRRTA
jgi:hypothetical protein